jgi:hypothetical protein
MQIPTGPNSLLPKATKSINGLQEENARLKDLVVTLSALVLKNIVHKSNNKHPRSKAAEEEMAEALDAAGHELMAKAVEMKSVLARHKWK